MTKRTPPDASQEKPSWPDQWFAEEEAATATSGGSRSGFTVLLFLLVLGGLVLFGDFSQNPAGLCSACHTMRPYHYTWQASSHSQQSCLACHADPGLRGAARLAQDMARFSYVQLTGSYILPIRLFAGVDDETCLRCHTFSRATTAAGDLIIPHADHSQAQVRCVACHDGVAHGNVGQRRATVSVPSDSWNLLEGQTQMSRAFTATPKEDCMLCHYNRRLQLSCQDCHMEDKTPADHLAADFLTTHGALAREVPNCHLCHAYDDRGRKVAVQPGENLMAYARRNDFCLDCHRQRPASHQLNFYDHGFAATGREDGCMVCHDNQPQAMLPEASSVYCGSCHPSPHHPNWQERHNRRRRGPIAISPGQEISGSCFACHVSTSCLSCHPPPTDMTLLPPQELFNPLPTLQ